MQTGIQTAESYTHIAFRKACDEGNLAKVNALIVGSTKEVLDKRDEDDRNALHYVAMHGMVPEIKILMGIGANPYRDNKGNFPCDLAIKNGKQEAEKILKQYDLDLELQVRSILNDFEKIKELLKMGANPEFKNKWSEERNAFHFATMKGNVQSMNMLIKHGIDVNIPDINGYLALHFAAKNGDTEAIKALAKVPEINFDNRNIFGFTPLHLASSCNKIKAVNAILETNKANLDLADYDGYTPILTAIQMGHIEIFKALMDANAKVDVKNKKGETALQIATKFGNTKIFELLVEKGVDLDETQLANLKDKVYAIATSKKREEGKDKVSKWLTSYNPDPHEERPSMDLETTLTEISQPQKNNERVPN